MEGLVQGDFAVVDAATKEPLGNITGFLETATPGEYDLTWDHDDGTYYVDVKVQGVTIEKSLEVTITTL